MFKLLTVPIVVLALGACAPSPVTLTRDEAYLSTVRGEYPDLNLSDSDLIRVATAACEAYDRGASKTEVHSVLASSGGNIVMEMSYAVGAGVAAYCPEHGNNYR